VTPIKWSHSGLKDFEGCARRFHEVKVLRTTRSRRQNILAMASKSMKRLNFILRDGTPIPPEYEYTEAYRRQASADQG